MLINTMSDLSAYAGKPGEIVTLLGYYTKGDKPEVNYAWSSGIGNDDGGYIINSLGGKWTACFNGKASVLDFGAKGDNKHNDTCNIQNCINAVDSVSFGTNNYVYLIEDTIRLRSNMIVSSERATIKQRINQKPIFDIHNLINIEINGFELEGKGDDFAASSTSQAVGIACGGSKDVRICNNYFLRFTYAAVSGLEWCKNIRIFENQVYGLGKTWLEKGNKKDNTGFTVCGEGIEIYSNRIEKTGQGIIMVERSCNFNIHDNTISTDWEHGIYVDKFCYNFNITNNLLKDCGKCGIKVQNYEKNGKEAEGFCRNITISNNNIDTTGGGGDGILFNNTDRSPLTLATNVNVVGNTLRNIGQHAINIRFVDNALVSNNSIDTTQNTGIYLQQTNNTKVSNNIVKNTQYNGIYDAGTGDDTLVENNTLLNIGLNPTINDGHNSAIMIENLLGSRAYTGNYSRGNLKSTPYGLFIQAGSQLKIRIENNYFIGNKIVGARFIVGGEPFKTFINNSFGAGTTLSNEVQNMPNGVIRSYPITFTSNVKPVGYYIIGDTCFKRNPSKNSNIGWINMATGNDPTNWVEIGGQARSLDESTSTVKDLIIALKKSGIMAS
jgi:parallel beta-helix repeat protein